MAYQFASASSQYLSASAPVTAVPLTLSAWVMPTASTLNNIVSVGNNLGDVATLLLLTDGRVLARFATGNLGTTNAFTTASAQQAQWSHIAAVFNSDSSRVAYLNGAASSVNTTSNPGSTAYSSALIGRRQDSSTGCDASIADVGIWNVALTAAEIASLAAGVACNKICPQSLQFYAPLVRDLVDVRGGLAITNNNSATVANHPRLYL